MKTAVIGLGSIGYVHMQVLKAQCKNVVAVCDINEEKATLFSDIPFYTDYIKMIEEVQPDVIHICTPHYLHAEMVIEGLNRNINVLCEKPLCISEDEIEKIITAEKASKAMLGVCHQNRYNSDNLFIKNYLSDKKILGGYATVVWSRGGKYYTDSNWRGKWNTEGGGVLINQALHTLDLMQWFIGMPKTITASVSNLTLNGVIEVEDTATIIGKGGADFVFMATNGSATQFVPMVSVRTENETVTVLQDKVITKEKVYDFVKGGAVYGKSCYGAGHNGLIEDFYDCVKTGRKFEIDGSEASKVIRLILSAYKSNNKTINI